MTYMHVGFASLTSNFRAEEKKSVYWLPSREFLLSTKITKAVVATRGSSRPDRERQTPAPVKERAKGENLRRDRPVTELDDRSEAPIIYLLVASGFLGSRLPADSRDLIGMYSENDNSSRTIEWKYDYIILRKKWSGTDSSVFIESMPINRSPVTRNNM